jgi:anti-sigma factor RsiW
MSLEDIRSECSDVAGLLQPYVDGELPNEEQERVAAHLDSCRGCRAAVTEQSWVRATLRALPREPAPRAVHAKVLLALDAIDREAIQARQAEQAAACRATPQPSLASRVWGRLSALGRGGLIMVPAGAAAIGLFFMVRDASLPAAPEAAKPALGIGSGMNPVAHPTKGHPPAEPDDVIGALAELPPRVGFQPQVPTTPVRDGVQLVGADLDRSAGNPAAKLRFELLRRGQPTGHHVLDRQLPATVADLRGRAVHVGGRRYHLDRDESGAAVLQFVVAGIAHALRLEGSPNDLARGQVVDDSGEAVPADFAPLFPVADHFSPGAGPRQ